MSHQAIIGGNDEITLSMMRGLLTVAVVCDALDSEGMLHQSPWVSLGPLTTSSVLVGRCRTMLWADMYHPDPRPYELELKGVDACTPDDVIIAAAGGSMRSGIWGELLATAARNAGCVGVIVDGAVRDVRQMREMAFPVFARGTCPYDSKNRQRVIDLDVPVEIGGMRFAPGDLVVADADGIIVVPREAEATVIRHACDKVATENQVRNAIRGGMRATQAVETFGAL